MIILGSLASVDLMEYIYTLPRCALGYHYKAFQWLILFVAHPLRFHWRCQSRTTKGPLLHHVIFKRVHSFAHSFPSRWIHRESTLPAPPGGTPNKALPHTMPGRTHIGSWLHYFHGWPLHKQVHRFGHDDYHRIPESIRQSPELLESTEHSSKPITPNPYSPTNREPR
jgi:hypothetical protein